MKSIEGYARVGDDRIAYQVRGDGPIDLCYISGSISHVDVRWDHPAMRAFLERLCSFSRLISFDRRGIGASDPVSVEHLPPAEEWAEDFVAVLDAVGSRRSAIFTLEIAGQLGMLFAAAHPEGTSALILANASARYLEADDYPFGWSVPTAASLLDAMVDAWGTEAFSDFVNPSGINDPEMRRWYAKLQRATCGPRVARAILENALAIDVRSVLPSIQAPTLVMAARSERLPLFVQGRYLSEHIKGAVFMPLETKDVSMFAEQSNVVLDEVQRFLTGASSVEDPDRVLATVMFTDIVGSTEMLARMGDRKWRITLDKHDSIVRTQLERHSGRLIGTSGDGALSTFDGPGRAIRCASDLHRSLGFEGIPIRIGIHTGEIELRPGGDVGGIAVHIGARISARAGAGETLVSGTVRDLVAGSVFQFEDQGMHELKGIADRWRIYKVLE